MTATLDQFTSTKVPAAEAAEVAQDFVEALAPHCERIQVAGSLRRMKPFVSDVEILFVPKFEADPHPGGDLFRPPPPINQAELAIRGLVLANVLRPRPNVREIPTWGPLNKLGVHVQSGLAIDLFTATAENWFNYLVCRTGSSESNIRVAAAAQARGWKWNPYGNGFSRPNGLTREIHLVTSEKEVFRFVGLPFLEPWKR